MRYEVVARKGLLLRESASTTSAKVCEVRKGAFVCDFGEERFVDGVERLEVVTAEGVRGWCSNKSQLLAPRDDTEQPAPEETGSQLVIAGLSEACHRDFAVEQLMFMGGERGAAGARAARGLVALATSASGFEVRVDRRDARGPRSFVVAILGWSGSGGHRRPTEGTARGGGAPFYDRYK